MSENKKVEICKSGVVSINTGCDPYFYVNSDNMLDSLKEKIDEINPDSDFDCKFAGKVTISVEFFCDCSEKGKGEQNAD